MSNQQDILSEILNLSPAERSKLMASVNAMATIEPDAGTADASADVSAALDEVWPIVVKQAKAKGLRLPPVPVVAHNRRLVKACEVVAEFTTFFGDLTKIERIAAINVCVDAIFRWFKDQLRGRVPIGVKTLPQQMSHVSEAVDLQFPGYREAGLLSITIRGLKPSK